MLVCLIAIGLLGGVAQMAVTEAYRLAPVSLIAPFEYTALPVAAVFGFTIWGHLPDRFVWLGAAIVAASSLYIVHREAARRAGAGVDSDRSIRNDCSSLALSSAIMLHPGAHLAAQH